MYSLLLTIVVLFILFIVLLAIPLSMSYSIIRDQQLHGYARFSGLFGLLKFQARFPRENKGETKAVTQSKSDKRKTTKAKHNVRGIALFKQSAFHRHIMNFIRRIFDATHAQDLYLRCRIGLGDPADTGMLWAILGPISGMLKNQQFMSIELEPEFIDSVVNIESHGHFRLIPLQFIALTIAFALSPTTIRAWRSMKQTY